MDIGGALRVGNGVRAIALLEFTAAWAVAVWLGFWGPLAVFLFGAPWMALLLALLVLAFGLPIAIVRRLVRWTSHLPAPPPSPAPHPLWTALTYLPTVAFSVLTTLSAGFFGLFGIAAMADVRTGLFLFYGALAVTLLLWPLVMALALQVEDEGARRLAALGGTDAAAGSAPRRRSDEASP